MKSAKLESEHFLLLAAGLFMLVSLIHEPFWKVGVLLAISSYATDLVKRIEEEDTK